MGAGVTGLGISAVMAAGPVGRGVLGPVCSTYWLVLTASMWKKTPPSVRHIESFVNMLHVKRSEYEEELRQFTDGTKKGKEEMKFVKIRRYLSCDF